MKLSRKCHNHDTWSSWGIKRRRDEAQNLAITDMQSKISHRRTSLERSAEKKTTKKLQGWGGGGGLNWFKSIEILPLIQNQIWKYSKKV